MFNLRVFGVDGPMATFYSAASLFQWKFPFGMACSIGTIPASGRQIVASISALGEIPLELDG